MSLLTSERMVYCTKCGKNLSEGLKFCGGCGTSVSKEGSEEKFEAFAEDFVEKFKNVINEGKFEEATHKFIQQIKTIIHDQELKKSNN